MINYTLETRFIYLIIKNCNCIYCRNIPILSSKDILAIKLYFKICKPDITSLIWQKIAKNILSIMAFAIKQKYITFKNKIF